MDRRSILRQAFDAVLLRLWQPSKALAAARIGMGVAAAAAFSPLHAQVKPPGPEDELLVRLRSRSVPLVQKFVQATGTEVLRMLPPGEGDGEVVAIVLMTRRVFQRVRGVPGLKAELLAQPPTSLAEVPRVGKGNRFADPGVLPEGVGSLVR